MSVDCKVRYGIPQARRGPPEDGLQPEYESERSVERAKLLGAETANRRTKTL
jgi:hypothetical protein